MKHKDYTTTMLLKEPFVWAFFHSERAPLIFLNFLKSYITHNYYGIDRGLNIYMIGLAMHRRKALESFFIASVIPHKYLTVCLQLWFCLDQGRKKELSLKCVSWTRLHRLSKNNFLSRHTTFIFIHNWEEKKK